MAVITPKSLSRAGVDPLFVPASAGGDTVPNNGNVMVCVRNANAAICTVTVNSIKACDQGADHDIMVAVPALTGERWIGPFATDRWNDATGSVGITYSVAPSVTVTAVQW